MSAKTEMHDLVALRRVTAGCQRRGAALAATGDTLSLTGRLRPRASRRGCRCGN